MATMPPHANPLAGLPFVNARTGRIDHPRNLMSWNTRILETGPKTILGENVTVAYPAGLHLDQNLPHSGTGHITLHELQRSFRLPYYHCFHLSHAAFSF